MPTRREQLQQDAHHRVPQLLKDNPEMMQRQLAKKAAGISVGGMHYLLTALIDKGFVKLGNFSASVDKRRYAYVLTPSGIAQRASMTHTFLKRKMDEYEALRQEIETLSTELEIEGPNTGAAKS
jgi:EPS-associated MarR family transcriptional regulator